MAGDLQNLSQLLQATLDPSQSKQGKFGPVAGGMAASHFQSDFPLPTTSSLTLR
jgi:hypothetical protein